MEIFTQNVELINSSISFKDDFYLFLILTIVFVIGAVISLSIVFILDAQEASLKYIVSTLAVFFVFMLGNVGATYWYESYDYTDKYIGTKEYESLQSVTRIMGLDAERTPLTLGYIGKVQRKSSALQKEMDEFLIRSKLLGIDRADSSEIALALLAQKTK